MIINSRYEKQIKLKEVGVEGQARLGKARVAIIGLGGLGCPCALSLAGCGIGEIFICDGDKIELSNLHRQVHFMQGDIGHNKASVLEKKIKNLNSEVVVKSCKENMCEENIQGLLSDYDIILDGTDNFKTKFLLNAYCFNTKKVFACASIDKWTGHVALFSYESGCLQCLFPYVEAGLFQDCNQAGMLAPSVHLVASLQTQLVMKWILFRDDPHLFYVVDTKAFHISPIGMRKNPECRVCADKRADVSCEPDVFLSYRDYLKLKNKNPKTILVDIREQEFFDAQNLPGAVNVPYRDIVRGTFKKNDFDVEETYVVYCENNLKAPVARGFLKESGFKNVFVLSLSSPFLSLRAKRGNLDSKAVAQEGIQRRII